MMSKRGWRRDGFGRADMLGVAILIAMGVVVGTMLGACILILMER
jgi:hypothetical protein